MNVLAICCALNNSYLGIKYNNQIDTEIIKSDKNYHSLYLISKIKEILDKKSINLSDMDIITVNCGPGSFTGIRVALSVAKIIAGELNKPLVPLKTNEILLKAFNADRLIMDARRDMYFVADKNDIQLIYKKDIDKLIENDAILLCDKNSSVCFENSICYEENDKDLASVMIDIALEKYQTEEDFNYLKVEANYIQTPPVFN